MRLSVATNFQDELLDRIKGMSVYEVYGKLPRDFFGGGRPSFMIDRITKRRVAEHVAYANRCGIEFNYLLNAAHLENREFTRKGQRAINKMLEWLSKIEVDSVTVSIPFLLELIKSRFPHLKVSVGVFAAINSVQKAKHWQDMGADSLTLDSLYCNREFKLLKRIRAAVRCDLRLMANNNCLQSCPYSIYHANLMASSSNNASRGKKFLIDYCLLNCTAKKTANPVDNIRSEWIRPEDLHHYEAIGYDNFKILERNAPIEVMVTRVRAYHERNYDGNLLDLTQHYPYTIKHEAIKKGLWWELKTFFRPFKVNIFRLNRIRQLNEMKGFYDREGGTPTVFIDNKALDGFIDFFFTSECHKKDCHTCGYCYDVADKVVEINKEAQGAVKRHYWEIFDDLYSGRMWSYELPRGACLTDDQQPIPLDHAPQATPVSWLKFSPKRH